MGLFSVVMHVRQVPDSEVARGLDLVIQGHGFVRYSNEPLSKPVPEPSDDSILGYAEAFFADDNLLAGDCMAAFGKLLQPHGESTDYPFVAWNEAPSTAWSDFTWLGYARQ
jgi:hypothetical protein